MDSRKVTIAVDREQSVSALLHRPRNARACLVLAHGAGAESRAALGWVIVGGMTFATLLSLFVVPVLYLLLARFTKPAGFIARKLSEMETRPDVDAGKSAAAE